MGHYVIQSSDSSIFSIPLLVSYPRPSDGEENFAGRIQSAPNPMDKRSTKLIIADSCAICFSGFSESGDHVLSSLNCGHVFGKSCIEKWVCMSKKCPQCNQKATKKQVRRLFPSCSAVVCEPDGSSDVVSPIDKEPGTGTPRRIALERENAGLKRELEELEAQLSQSRSPLADVGGDSPHLRFERCMVCGPIGDRPFVVAAIKDSRTKWQLTLVAIPLGASMSLDPSLALSAAAYRIDVAVWSVRCVLLAESSFIFGCSSGEILSWNPREGTVVCTPLIPDSAVWSIGSLPHSFVLGDSRGRLHSITGSRISVREICCAPIHSLLISDGGNGKRRVIACSIFRTVIITGDDLIVKDISSQVGSGCVGMELSGGLLVASFRGNLIRGAIARVDIFDISGEEVKKLHSLTGHVNFLSMMKAKLVHSLDDGIRLCSPCEKNECVFWSLNDKPSSWNRPLKHLLSKESMSHAASSQVEVVVDPNGPNEYIVVCIATHSLQTTRVTTSQSRPNSLV